MALAAGVTSCGEKEEVYDIDGVSGQIVLAPSINASGNFVKTPIGMIAPPVSWTVTPRSRMKAAEGLYAIFAIDNSLIAEYNAKNNTEYKALPDGVAMLQNDTVRFDVGRTVGTSGVTIKLTDNADLLGQLTVGENYIVPVRLASVAGGAMARSVSNVSYVTFGVTEKMINDEGNPTGTIVTKDLRTDWTGTAIDGGTDTRWNHPLQETGSYSYGTYPSGSAAVIDLAKEYTFDGIYSYPYYGMSSYAMLRMGVGIEVSKDGENWQKLGDLDGYRTTVAFYAPVTARYIKMKNNSSAQFRAYTTAFSIYAL